MDLDRYLGLSPGDATPSPGDAGAEGALPNLAARLSRRLVLVGGLAFAAGWYAVVKLRLLDATTSAVGFALALALLATLAVLAWRRRQRAGDSGASLPGNALRAGDVPRAIELAKRCLAGDPSPAERAEVERVLALCAAFERRLEEASVLVEMAEGSADAAAPATRRTAKACAAATRAFVAALGGGAPADDGAKALAMDGEIALAQARVRLLEAYARGDDEGVKVAARALADAAADGGTPFDRALAEQLAQRAEARAADAHHPRADVAVADEGDTPEAFARWIVARLDRQG